LWMSRASKAAVLMNGLRWLVAGPPHKASLHDTSPPFPCIISASPCHFLSAVSITWDLSFPGGVFC
jgi:hypothetical protein